MHLKPIILAILASALCFGISNGQSNTYTISGLIRDAHSGESLPGANVFVPELNRGTSTNNYGFYALTLPEGDHTITFSYVGYNSVHLTVTADKNIRQDIKLMPAIELDEVVVRGETAGTGALQMGTLNIPMLQAARLPVLLGEKDIMKAFQLMPGVQRGTEGTGGLFVRGGSNDQNLIILDDAVIYNANHLFGFFSLFNSAAIKDVTLIKGGFPARYGGRLSSVIDITMKEGDMQSFKGEAGIGIIASRFTLEGPIQKGSSSFLVAGRRTYFDVLSKPFLSEEEKVGYFFHDLNLKTNFILNDNNRLYISGFLGKDELNTQYKDRDIKDKTGLNWRNYQTVARLNTVLTPGFFVNNTLVYSRYKSGIYFQQDDLHLKKEYRFDHSNGIHDLSFKSDFVLGTLLGHTIRFGSVLGWYSFLPRKMVIKNEYVNAFTTETEKVSASHHAIYIEDEYVRGKWMYNIGFRQNFYHSGNSWQLRTEPRVSIGFKPTGSSSIKASYTEMNQYMHLMSSSGVMLPTDIWLPASNKTLPQRSRQYALSLGQKLSKLSADLTIEAYFKQSSNVLTYRDGASFFFIDESNPQTKIDWEDNVVGGQGEAFGIEFLLHRKYGKWNGWAAYTWSKAKVKYDEVNSGNWFPANFDRRHDISLVFMYDLNPNRKLSASWVFMSGNPITLPFHTSIAHMPFDFEGGTSPPPFVVVDYFGSRNNYQTENYHRLDIGMQFSKPRKRGTRIWEIGIYNVYNRKNAFSYYIGYHYENDKRLLKKLTLFPIIPSITYVRTF